MNIFLTLLSQGSNSRIFGKVTPPPGVSAIAADVSGLATLLGIVVKILIVVAGLYSFINIILAGYQFLSAGGDSKAVQNAWAKLWQTLIGLLFVAGSFVLAAIFGQLLFKDPTFLLQLRIFIPGSPFEGGTIPGETR